MKVVTDKLASYSAVKKELIPTVENSTVQYENNGCDQSYLTKAHQPTRQQERHMRKFKSHGQAQRFLNCHGVINNSFRPGRHLIAFSRSNLISCNPQLWY